MKYHNQKCEYNDIKFDSKKEMNRYIELSLMERNGYIHDLKLQVPFEVLPSFKLNGKTYRNVRYIADFTYIENGQLVVEDAKGLKTDAYKLKKKLMAYKGIEIKET